MKNMVSLITAMLFIFLISPAGAGDLATPTPSVVDGYMTVDGSRIKTNDDGYMMICSHAFSLFQTRSDCNHWSLPHEYLFEKIGHKNAILVDFDIAQNGDFVFK